jgi:hypothetical protein
MCDANVPPPLFTAKSGDYPTKTAKRGGGSVLNLDDIFGDVVFTPEGDTVFLSEQQTEEDALWNSGEGGTVATMASKPTADGQYKAVDQGGGLYTTHLSDSGAISSTMGKVTDGKRTASVPYKKAPQSRNHLEYAAPKKKKRSKKDKNMSESEKADKR